MLYPEQGRHERKWVPTYLVVLSTLSVCQMIRPRPNWGFRICMQKLSLSSVHPISVYMTLDASKINAAFVAKLWPSIRMTRPACRWYLFLLLIWMLMTVPLYLVTMTFNSASQPRKPFTGRPIKSVNGLGWLWFRCSTYPVIPAHPFLPNGSRIWETME